MTLLLAAFLAAPQELEPVEDLGLRVRKGFRVTVYSDHTQANDLYAMTLDPEGRIVVTGQGWIRRLDDLDGDGRCDKVVELAKCGSGGMGMRFDGTDLLVACDGGIWRYRDADGDGAFEGERQRLAKFQGGEHGHHAIRKGPDGHWYFIAGNDGLIGPEHVTAAHPAIAVPQTGGIVRWSPDWKTSEVIAHGFRNPYDFDWNAQGDLFTYDSDCERDYFLPWYTPTRIFHVGVGLHHGWRLRGYLRSYCRKDDAPDNVDILWPVGRGSPTGVCVVRHEGWPDRYRGGLFALEWTFGKVWFFPLSTSGASYETKGEVFLESTGSEGFAPTDLEIAPDGSLLISIGGRRTRGAVYRVVPTPMKRTPKQTTLQIILRHPQPLEAWARSEWEPLARTIGAEPIEAAIGDEASTTSDRVRAVEVLVDLFDGLTAESAAVATARVEPEVRARAAWAMGVKPREEFWKLLEEASMDPDTRVRRWTIEALAVRAGDARDARLHALVEGVLPGNLGHPDKRVRQAAARLAARLPQAGWRSLESRQDQRRGQPGLTLALARQERGLGDVDAVLAALGESTDPSLALQSARLIVAALGDTNLAVPGVEIHSDYAVAKRPDAAVAARILSKFRPLYGSGDARLDAEVGRLLAVLEDDAPATLATALGFIGEGSSSTADVHALVVLSRLRAAWPEGFAARAADAILGLTRKLEGQEQRSKQVWGQRVQELAVIFVSKDPTFADALLAHPALVNPGHVGLAEAMPGKRGEAAARRFLEAVRRDASFAWSEALLRLLWRLPREEVIPVLRAQWSNYGLRDSIVLALAAEPDPQDREKFVTGLESPNGEAAQKALESLEKLPRDPEPARLVPVLKLLRRLSLEPKAVDRRKRLAELVARQSGRSFQIRESGTGPSELLAAYQPLFDAFPELRRELESGSTDVASRIKAVPWESGDAVRGSAVFRARGCQTCHAVQGALGPNLAGAAGRFSREDLFAAIGDPSRDVAPLYRTTVFQTKDGAVHMGIVAFESADGYLVQTGATTTVRLATGDLAGLRPGTMSIMPNGLLDGLTPQEIADLYAHLRTLK